MPIYHWDAEKDALLQRARGISFRDVVRHIEQGGLLDTPACWTPLSAPTLCVIPARAFSSSALVTTPILKTTPGGFPLKLPKPASFCVLPGLAANPHGTTCGDFWRPP